ncbi:Hpt domain-containing protein [Pararhodobacter marinus]|uniref:HPt domain-containing protein n=1 Tax=Pararhodobacter marinus TaxID=2184063 RepID=A0A2U2C644_9RHOB|nr:Hpt domain-containing protein [Pararhodobacter marinus]PWE27301.1 hypothetical protein C4N9_16695 [Pararhodobacter marinus]
MDDIYRMGVPRPSTPAMDLEVLESLFSMGGDELRAELCAQLITDFKRIAAELDSEEGSKIARAAHELKGLAATVGAARLADMARSVDQVAEGMAAPALIVVTRPLRSEIDTVLYHLKQAATGGPDARAPGKTPEA